MSRSAKSKPRSPSSTPPPRSFDLHGIVLLTIGALLLAGLRFGDDGLLLGWLSSSLRMLLGRVADVLPFVFFVLGARCLLGGKPPTIPSAAGLLLLVVVAIGVLHLKVPSGEEFAPTASGEGLLHPLQWYGGVLGAALVWLLRRLVGDLGCPIVLGMMGLAGVVALLDKSLAELVDDARDAYTAWRNRPRPVRPARPRRRQAVTAPAARPLPPVPTTEFPAELLDEPTPAPAPIVEPSDDLDVPSFLPPSGPAPGEPPPAPEELAATNQSRAWDPNQPSSQPLLADGAEVDPKQLVLPGMPKPKAMSELEEAWWAEGEPTTYRLPPLDLVKAPDQRPLPDRAPEIRANSERLESTLASFRIEAQVVNTEIGPTVTRYELELAQGIRVNKVAILTDDIALALASEGIRIEAPVPGKGVVGIEVPNQTREIVHLHPILASREFRTNPGALPFVVGKDIAGHVRLAELTKMPHCLVAGITNSGKSVCLNCIIISLLYRLSPRELRFLMIDPKRVELTLYDGIPHLDRPVVTDPQDAADLLRGAVREMMARYDRLHELGVRNLASYNQHVPEDERMPYIVIIIDELAELMMLARAEVEASICRLAQLARATGIHLVVATQRPSVNVVTGSIKANIGTRIAFAVAQQVDSRVILDQVGAERLIGRGDMLYSPIDTGKPQRIQGAFIDEAQVHQLVEYLKAMPSTLRVLCGDSIIQPVAADDPDDSAVVVEDKDLDDLFWDCVKFIRMEGEASTSRLQRRFGIGYNRAGRITDQMEALGIVGPSRGSRPREVLPGGPSGPSEGDGLFDEFADDDAAS